MKILDKDFELKYSLRSMFIYEELSGKPFEVKTMLDEYTLLYACLLSVKDNPSLEFDDFIDWCSDHPEVIEEFNDYMGKEMRRREILGKKKLKEKENL